MSINNASATAVLAHVVLWTDLSVHVLDFNVYLTGYDVQSINLRDILVHGNLPLTASAGQDPATPSARRARRRRTSTSPAATASCRTTTRPSPTIYIDHVQITLTGQGSPFFVSAAMRRRMTMGIDIARGYVTVDTVNACQRTFPRIPATSSTAAASRDQPERPLGRLLLRRHRAELRPGRDSGAHRGRIAGASAPANYTFYYRYSALNGFGADQREGLGNVFAVRDSSMAASSMAARASSTWRDAKRTSRRSAALWAVPPPFPLGQNQIVVFDEEENFETPDGCTISPCPTEEGLSPFPWETQRTKVRQRHSAVRRRTSAGSSST